MISCRSFTKFLLLLSSPTSIYQYVIKNIEFYLLHLSSSLNAGSFRYKSQLATISLLFLIPLSISNYYISINIICHCSSRLLSNASDLCRWFDRTKFWKYLKIVLLMVEPITHTLRQGVSIECEYNLSKRCPLIYILVNLLLSKVCHFAFIK